MKRIVVFSLMVMLAFPGRGVAAAAAAEEKGRAWFDFGVFAFEEGQYRKAEEDLLKAVKSEPDNPAYSHQLARVYMKTDQYEQAMIYLTKAWRISGRDSIHIPDLEYDLAFSYFKLKNYAVASYLMTGIAKKEPDNVLAIYHAGMSLYKEGRYEEAVEYILKAGSLNPGLKSDCNLIAGACYYKLNRFSESLRQFKAVKENPDAEKLHEKADQWIALTVVNKKQKRPWKLNARTGYRYDDNARLEPLDRNYYDDNGDFAFVLSASADIIPVIQDHFRIGTGYTHHQTFYSRFSEYNLTGSQIKLFGVYVFNPFHFKLTYQPFKYWVDGEDFMSGYWFVPQASWQVNERLNTALSFHHAFNRYVENADKNSRMNAYQISVNYRLPNENGSIFGKIGFENNSAAQPFESYETLKAEGGMHAVLPLDFNLTVAGSFYDRKYDAPEASGCIARDDDRYSATLGLSHPFFYEWLSIMAEYQYTKRISNYVDKKYEKNRFSVFMDADY